MTSSLQASPRAAEEPPGDLEAKGVRPVESLSGAWAAVAIMQVLYILSMIDRNLVSLMVGPIKRTLQISDLQVSLLQGVSFGLFYSTFGLASGWLLDRFSRRTVVYAGISIWSVCAAGCGLARNFGQLIGARLGVGAGEAVLSPASYAMISTLFPQSKFGLAIGVFGMGAVIGGGLSLALGGMALAWLTQIGPITVPLVGQLEPWQAEFLLFGGPGLLIAPLVFLIPRRADHRGGARGADGGVSFTGFLARRWGYLTCHFTGFGVVTLIAYGQSAWMPAYFVRHFGMNIGLVGNLLALVISVGGVAGFAIAGIVGDRWYGRGVTDAHFRYSIVATGILAVCGVAAYRVDSATACLVLLGLAYTALSISGLAAAHLQIVTPLALRARVSALYMMVVNVIGMTLGPSVVAFFTDAVFGDPARVGDSIMLIYAIFGPLAVIVFALGLRPARRAVRDASAEPAAAASGRI